MRTIIAGSRSITNYIILLNAIVECPWNISTIISGGANGVDKLGERLAVDLSLPLEIFKADWNQHGKSAGYKRNVLMAENADALISIWDGQSRGTANMIEIAKNKKLLCFCVEAF